MSPRVDCFQLDLLIREVLCGYRSYEQLLNSNEEKQAEIRQLQAYDFLLQN